MKKIIILILCSFIFSAIFAQKKRKNRGYGTKMEYLNSLQLTTGTGTSTYYGDLCDNADCMVFRPQASVGILYRNTKRLLIRNEFHYLRLFGTDEGGINAARN